MLADFASSQRAAAPAAVLDLDHLHRFTLGQAALDREILGLFAATMAQTLDALESARDAVQWHRLAHTLKGSALGVGAQRLASLAREAEMIKDVASDARRPMLERLRAAAADVIEEARCQNLL